jgi:DNA topoisomerase-1
MMIYKNGRYGRFLACPNYPECQSTQAIDKEGKPLVKEEKKAELADFKCEICGGDVVIRNGRFGSFYACANYPTCKFTKQKVNRIGVTCPDCGADVVAKRGRQRVTFYSCEKYPECQFSSWDIPTAETCHDCGDRLLYRKLRKTLLCRNKSCDYKRAEDLSAKEQENENE